MKNRMVGRCEPLSGIKIPTGSFYIFRSIGEEHQKMVFHQVLYPLG